MFRTAQDVVEYLFASVGGGAQDSEHRAIREAVFRGYEEVVSARNWRFHTSTATVTMQAGVNEYALPADMFSVDSMMPEHRLALATYVSPFEWMQLDVLKMALGQPLFWTVMRSTDPAKFDTYVMRVAGRPVDGEVMHFTYRRKPRALRYTGYEQGSRAGTISASGAAVAGAGTAFDKGMEGAALRLGTPANYPESLSGIHPYREQLKIATVTDADSLSLVSPASPCMACKYTVTDILDIADTMYRAVLSATEMWYAQLQGKNVDGATAVYYRNLKLAFEQDAVAPLTGQSTGGATLGPRAFGWASPSFPDTGV